MPKLVLIFNDETEAVMKHLFIRAKAGEKFRVSTGSKVFRSNFNVYATEKIELIKVIL